VTYVPATKSGLRRALSLNLQALYHRAWQLVHPHGDPRPAFLIGAGRSGTDVVVESLGRSPEVDVYNETHPGAFENWRLRDDETLRGLVRSSRARRVLFKPIVETHRAHRMLAFAEDSRVLFAMRNPWDTVNSMVRFFDTIDHVARAWAASDPDDDYPLNATPSLRAGYMELYSEELTELEQAALIWWVRNALYTELELDSHDRVLAIHYDELVRDPGSTLEEVCGFLGIRYRPRMAEGIYASSKGKNPPPALRPEIDAACRSVWERLTRGRATR
jgi:hypothetical protein